MKKMPSNNTRTSHSGKVAVVTGSPFKRQLEESLSRPSTTKTTQKS
jgi:hypothetical protein